MADENEKQGRRGIWRQRGWRFAAVISVCMSLILGVLLLLMVNYLAYRLGPYRLHLGGAGFYSLSEKTTGLLESLEEPVTVESFFEQSHGLYNDVRMLLKEYEYECARIGQTNLKIEMIDPDRDLMKTRELRQKYGIENPNVVVFECHGRQKFVEVADIIETTPEVDMEKLLGGSKSAYKKKVAFMGEVAFSSAIQNITQSAAPIVYFLAGHGERDVDDFSEQVGYSSIARAMRRDNVILKVLRLAEHREVPQDCAAIVIAGPDRKLSSVEAGMLSDYLNKSGRILFLADPATTTGLEELMEKWGVRFSSGVVVGLTLRGRELVVTNYGDHPITRKIKNLMTMFYMPRCMKIVEKGGSGEVQADKPSVTVLASNSEQGWEELNLNQAPPKYDEGVDIPGPNAVAVAIEKGAVSGIDIQLKPTRVVIIGDSDFVSNGTLKDGIGGNVDFFLSAVNWLVEREDIMAIAPKLPGRIELGMTQDQQRIAFAILVLGLPVLSALLGIGVWIRRRQ